MNHDVQNLGLHWYGVGNWQAPYWFVGMEPGGDHGEAWPRIWREEFQSAELIDCRKHVELCGGAKWYVPNPPTQPTWRGIIRTVLAFKKMPYDLESVRAYQYEKFGSVDGEIASLELSAFSARNMTCNVPRELFREERTAKLRQRLMEYKPLFCVFYGKTYRKCYERVVGAFNSEGLRWLGNDTICALALHPARKSNSEYWASLGRKLHEQVNVIPQTRVPFCCGTLESDI